MTASGIDVAQRVDRGLTTPLEVGIVDGTGSRTYFQERDPGALASLPIPSVSELSEARILYVDWYDGGRVIEAMERARDLGVPVFLNLESKYCDAPNLSDLLRLTNVCQVSMDEPQASGNPPDIARDLLAEGVDVALITLGAEGCIVAQGTQLFRIRPPKVKVIDGYGAGAAFSAGVIYGIQAEWPLERSARFATAYAGLKCGMAGSPVLAVDALQETAKGLPSQLLSL